MNNPLAQKYNYYLNESHRLNEELKSEEAYSELLENVLFELLGEEDFTKLMEVAIKGTVTHNEKGEPLSPERSARRAKRIGHIVDLGQKAVAQGDDDLQNRIGHSLVAKGVKAPVTSTNTWDKDHDRVVSALQNRYHGEHVPLEVQDDKAGIGGHRSVRQVADNEQRYLSKARRDSIQAARQKAAEDKAAEAKRVQAEKDRKTNTF